MTALKGPVKDCGYLVEDGVVRIPLHRTVPGRQIVRIGYYTADPGPGTVRAGGVSYQVRFTDGLHVMNVVATGPLAEIEVSRSQDIAPLCVTDVEVGLPDAPRTGRTGRGGRTSPPPGAAAAAAAP